MSLRGTRYDPRIIHLSSSLGLEQCCQKFSSGNVITEQLRPIFEVSDLATRSSFCFLERFSTYYEVDHSASWNADLSRVIREFVFQTELAGQVHIIRRPTQTDARCLLMIHRTFAVHRSELCFGRLNRNRR